MNWTDVKRDLRMTFTETLNLLRSVSNEVVGDHVDLVAKRLASYEEGGKVSGMDGRGSPNGTTAKSETVTPRFSRMRPTHPLAEHAHALSHSQTLPRHPTTRELGRSSATRS